MTSRPYQVLFRLLILFPTLLILSGCIQYSPNPTITPTIAATSTAEPAGLNQDEMITLKSLAKINDYPFYVMHYRGNYEYPQIGFTKPFEMDFACSLFAALGEGGDMFFGRNFDWSFSPALFLFTNPPDGYASVSMVDLEYLGYDPRETIDLTELPWQERIDLLSAPSMPFDGMNEYGLAVGMAAVPEDYQEHALYDQSKPVIGSIGILRQVLDHARNVDEAVALFEQSNIDFRGGPLLHYLIADAGGNAVLIEYYQKEIVVLPNENPWHMMTNHIRCTAQGDGGCPRYWALSEQLSSTKGQLDAKSALHLLSQVSQRMTQWSAVYDMSSGAIQVAIGGDYDTVYTFSLDLASK